MKYLKMEEKITTEDENMMILVFNQALSIEFDEEYRSPGWNRFKKQNA